LSAKQLSEFGWRTRDYLRRFVEDGRVATLIWFLFASFAIAGIEWALSPAIYGLWLDIRMSDGSYFVLLLALASLWLVVVIAGFIKCGWPGLLMLTAIKWGLFPIYLFVLIYWSCLALHECL
jgi:hypothetical protein